MPSGLVQHAPRLFVLAGGFLLLGAGTASISTLVPPTQAAAAPATATGTVWLLRLPPEPDLGDDPAGDAGAANPSDSPPGPDDPAPPHPGATDQTLAWVAPDGSTGPGVSAIFRVFGKSDGLTWALRVAHCESHYDPGAVNPDSGAAGLFQFMPSTWNAYFGGANIWDPLSQARAALDFYQRGWTDQWACK